VAVLFTTVLTVFLIAHGPRLVRGFLRQLRDDDQRRAVSTVLLLAYRRSWSYVMMILVKAVVVGFLAYGLSRALDLPSSSVLALITALASLVPYLGVLLGGLPLVLLAGGVHDGWAAALAALGVITLQVLDGWVTAKVVEPRSLRVGPAVSLATVLLGTTLYGVGGAAVALPVAAFVVAIAYEGLPDARDVGAAEPERVLP
jgi:predicted PurR-regulated permease PerM